MSVSSFFDTWEGLVRVVLVGVLAYASLVGMLRITGNRTLSKMSAFDLVVTVALGSTLASIILSKDVALAEGILAFATLIALQFAVTWTSVRWRPLRQVVKSEPILLVYRGKLLHRQLQQARVLEDEVLAAVRTSGQDSLEAVEAVVLETDGAMSIVMPGSSSDRAALRPVSGYEHTRRE